MQNLAIILVFLLGSMLFLSLADASSNSFTEVRCLLFLFAFDRRKNKRKFVWFFVSLLKENDQLVETRLKRSLANKRFYEFGARSTNDDELESFIDDIHRLRRFYEFGAKKRLATRFYDFGSKKKRSAEWKTQYDQQNPPTRNKDRKRSRFFWFSFFFNFNNWRFERKKKIIFERRQRETFFPKTPKN